MKPARLLFAYVLMALLLISLSCKKETNDDVNVPPSNMRPVANAGPDRTVNIVSCYAGRSVELDGSQSYAPNNVRLYYYWVKVSGPLCSVSADINSPKAQVTSLTNGQYLFELMVSTNGASAAPDKGLTSRDTMTVTVTGSPAPTEVSLDATLSTQFTFTKKYRERIYLDFFNAYMDFFYDLTTVRGSFNLPAVGQMNVWIDERADTAFASTNHSTRMGLTCTTCVPSQHLEGICSINFKKLIQEGGGSFSETLKIDGGSARQCDPGIFANLVPITVSGRLDTTVHTISLSLKGKVYF